MKVTTWWIKEAHKNEKRESWGDELEEVEVNNEINSGDGSKDGIDSEEHHE